MTRPCKLNNCKVIISTNSASYDDHNEKGKKRDPKREENQETTFYLFSANGETLKLA